jgi:hypothetical protein
MLLDYFASALPSRPPHLLLCTHQHGFAGFGGQSMDRKRATGICDQTWSALLIAMGGPQGLHSAFR